MSHFTVLVIGDNADEQLAPYQENNMDDCPKEYLEFNSVQKELEEDYEKEEKDVKVKYPTFKQYAEEYCGYRLDKKKKEYGYWENPNAKWDWYVLGGRWSGFFPLKKDGKLVNSALKKDIDFDALLDLKAKHAEEGWEESKAEKPELRELIYGIKKGQTKEQYVQSLRKFSTFAVVKDGKWYEKGEMGWWGITSNEKDEEAWANEFTKLVAGLPDDTLLSIYDCHI